MKKILLLLSGFFLFNITYSQSCIPSTTTCPNGDAVEAFGGICDTTLANGRVNLPYSDVVQFFIQGVCFDPEPLTGEPAPFNATARITSLGNFQFNSLPNGITAGTNQSSYNIPRNATVFGCSFVNGTPTQAGLFRVIINISASYTTANCFAFTQTGTESVPFGISLLILPDPNFTLASSYCQTETTVPLVPLGTPGGTFSGPGVSGTNFNPSLAGPGTHQIKYVVSAQQGAAIGPAVDSSIVTVQVAPTSLWYADSDGDGFGDSENSVSSCTQPTGFVTNSNDCNDNNSAINPNTIWFADLDGDGFHNPGNLLIQCAQPSNFILLSTSSGVDCNDNDNTILGATVWFADSDGDGFGNPNSSITSCTQPSGFVDNNLDCDDTNNLIGSGANEVWYADLDEDGFINELDSFFACSPPFGYIGLNDALGIDCDDNNPQIGAPTQTFYADLDGDGFGNPNNSVVACQIPAGFVTIPLDCNDSDPFFNPNTQWFADLDGDEYHNPNQMETSCERPTGFILLSESLGVDCDDNDATFNTPLTWYADLDGDEYHNPQDSLVQCTQPSGYILLNQSLGVDCDDNDGDLTVPLTWYADIDGDGYHNPDFAITQCFRPTNFLLLSESLGEDCDDINPEVNPGATEIPDNGIDDNCSGEDLVSSVSTLQFNTFKLYPNPGSQELFIEIDVTAGSDLRLTMQAIVGRSVYTETIKGGSYRTLQINTAALPNGLYTISITDGQLQKVVKWVKVQ